MRGRLQKAIRSRLGFIPRSAQWTQSRAHGSASSRALGIVTPQLSQVPYTPRFNRFSADSISMRVLRSRSSIAANISLETFSHAAAISSSGSRSVGTSMRCSLMRWRDAFRKDLSCLSSAAKVLEGVRESVDIFRITSEGNLTRHVRTECGARLRMAQADIRKLLHSRCAFNPSDSVAGLDKRCSVRLSDSVRTNFDANGENNLSLPRECPIFICFFLIGIPVSQIHRSIHCLERIGR